MPASCRPARGRRRAAVPAISAAQEPAPDGAVSIAPDVTIESHQQGGNFCLTQGHNVYASATFNARTVGFISYYEVWHHYSTSGNWSLGYIRNRATEVRGYIPTGVFQYETTHDALSCH